MGMRAYFRMISPLQLEEIKSNPSLLDDLEDEAVDEWLDSPETEHPQIEHDDRIEIDKAWHGIHYLLNGDPWEGEAPLGNVILGGENIGRNADEDYRYLTPAEVKEVAGALWTVPAQVLRSRYDPEAMDQAEIYPEIWVRDGEEGLEYLLEYYEDVVSFYNRAAHRGMAVLISIG